MSRLDDFLNEHVKKIEEERYRTADGKLRGKVKLLMKAPYYYDFKQFYEENRWRSFDDTELWNWLSCNFANNVLWAKKSSFNEMTPDEAAGMITKFRMKVLNGKFHTSNPDAGKVLKSVVRCYLSGKPVEEFAYDETMSTLNILEAMNAVEVILPLRALERLGEVCNPPAVSVYDRVMKLCDKLKKEGFEFNEKHRREFEVRVRLMDEDEKLRKFVVGKDKLIDCGHLIQALYEAPSMYIVNKNGWCKKLREEFIENKKWGKGTPYSGYLTQSKKLSSEAKRVLESEEFKEKESEMLKENKED